MRRVKKLEAIELESSEKSLVYKLAKKLANILEANEKQRM